MKKRKNGPMNGPAVSPDLRGLLADVRKFLKRFVVFPSKHEAVAVTLWVAHTQVVDAADATPYLAVTSPEKQSGKTRLLEVLELLVAKPWRAILPSEAIVYRKLDANQPTLILDEVDAIFSDRTGKHEGLRAMLNAGHRRGSTVPRCVGQSFVPRDFQVFSAKAIAGIGNLPDTVADRSIPIRLARRAPTEQVERFRHAAVSQEAAPLRQALECWGAVVVNSLRGARPFIPAALGDRAADGWEPLFAIAEAAGGKWPQRAQDAAVALQSSPAAQDPTTGVKLLSAIRTIFEQVDRDRISTEHLLRRLVRRDDGPWADWWEEKMRADNTRGPASHLARLLRSFKITSTTLRIKGRVMKGYMRLEFQDAFNRYLPPEG